MDQWLSRNNVGFGMSLEFFLIRIYSCEYRIMYYHTIELYFKSNVLFDNVSGDKNIDDRQCQDYCHVFL